MRVAFNNAYRRILDLPWRCSASVMYATYGIYNLEAIIRKQTFGFIGRLRKSCNTISGVSRISFRGGFKIFLEKLGYLHGAKRHAARGEATRLLGGFGGMLPRENFLKWCNLVRFREYFAQILSKKYFKKSHFLYKNNR